MRHQVARPFATRCRGGEEKPQGFRGIVLGHVGIGDGKIRHPQWRSYTHRQIAPFLVMKYYSGGGKQLGIRNVFPNHARAGGGKE